MKDIGIIYDGGTGHTKEVAEKIRDRFGEETAECRPIGEVSADEISRYRHLVLGAPTVGDTGLPEGWKENFGKLHMANLEGKEVAVFGLGDQAAYPDRFADAVGIIAKELQEKGARIVGETPADDYSFTDSAALDRGRTMGGETGNALHGFPPEGLERQSSGPERRFYGLVIDEEHQHERTDERIESWVRDLKDTFHV